MTESYDPSDEDQGDELEVDDGQGPQVSYEATVEGLAAFAGEVAKAVATVGGGDPFAAALMGGAGAGAVKGIGTAARRLWERRRARRVVMAQEAWRPSRRGVREPIKSRSYSAALVMVRATNRPASVDVSTPRSSSTRRHPLRRARSRRSAKSAVERETRSSLAATRTSASPRSRASRASRASSNAGRSRFLAGRPASAVRQSVQPSRRGAVDESGALSVEAGAALDLLVGLNRPVVSGDLNVPRGWRKHEYRSPWWSKVQVMTNDMVGEPDDVDALRAAIDDAIDPPGSLAWDHVMQAVIFGADRDPDAPTPRDIVDRASPPRPDDQSSI